jgi:hypothetical protein
LDDKKVAKIIKKTNKINVDFKILFINASLPSIRRSIRIEKEYANRRDLHPRLTNKAVCFLIKIIYLHGLIQENDITKKKVAFDQEIGNKTTYILL